MYIYIYIYIYIYMYIPKMGREHDADIVFAAVCATCEAPQQPCGRLQIAIILIAIILIAII